MLEIFKKEIELNLLLNGSNIMFGFIQNQNINEIKDDNDIFLIIAETNNLFKGDVFCILDKTFDFEENIKNIMFQENYEFETKKTPEYKEIKYLIKKEIVDAKIIKTKEINEEIINKLNIKEDFIDIFNKICEENNYPLRYEDNFYIIVYELEELKKNIFIN